MNDEREPLRVWTIFDNPDDFPGKIITRETVVGHKGPIPSPFAYVSPTIEHARQALEAMGLVCLGRDPQDEPSIVEVWV
jgi:hypothetical protein